MNGSDIKWLKEMFEQHNKDQQKYLDTKFKALDDNISELKESVGNLQLEIEDVEAACLECMDDELEKTNKKIYFASASAVILSLLLWTAFGTDALAIVLKFISGTPIP